MEHYIHHLLLTIYLVYDNNDFYLIGKNSIIVVFDK